MRRPEPEMSHSSKLIVRVCAVAIAGWLLLFMLSLIFADAALVLLIPALILGPPVLFCVLAYALVRAVRDLVRHPEFRTPGNIAVALAGLIGLLAGAWWWYVGASQHNAAL